MENTEPIWIDPVIYTTRPEAAGRSPVEMATYDLLEQLDMPYWRLDHDQTPSIEDCKHIDALLGIQICKNLFLCNSQKTRFYLLMMPGEKKFRTKDLSQQIQSARLSFADGQAMAHYLKVQPGSASPLSLMNDTEGAVQLLIDQEVLDESYLGCHPCVNTSSLKIKTADLLDKFLPHIQHSVITVNL